jgi:hypothetical protein
VRPGLSAWPLFESEARVVGVIREGYRCGAPRWVGRSGGVQIELEPARDDTDRRESCRPVAAARGEAPGYSEAWRGLHPDVAPQGPEPRDLDLERVLEARAAFGFGENCEGPVADLALSADGRLAAYALLAPGGSEVAVVDLGEGTQGPERRIGRAEALPPRRLAWSRGGELVVWEPASPSQRAASLSPLSQARIQAFWHPETLPAAPAAPAPALELAEPVRRAPIDPEDLNDEADARWRDRSFAIHHHLDVATGLPADSLDVVAKDGSRLSIPLPGEVCGPSGRFGRPHYRISADGRAGLDLRFVTGGCHVVRVSLETGEWTQLDGEPGPASCRSSRRIPATHLHTALRGYAREIEAAVVAAGADPQAAYVLHVAPDGAARAETRGFDGTPRSVDLPPFPIRTPLARIHVSMLGSATPGPEGAPSPIAGPEPL